MACCPHCQEAENIFNDKWATSELKAYQRRGPKHSTRLLLDALKAQSVAGMTLLDIGGGIGAIQLELLAAGVRHATDVDASTSYIALARTVAAQRGLAGRIDYQYGDFVDLAAQIDPADIVTLDRVICCYPDMEVLVNLSSARAKKLYGLVYPRDSLISKLVVSLTNFFLFALRHNPFRNYVHSTQDIDRIARQNNLHRVYLHDTFLWRVAIYVRE